jgi:hypothetical protein
MLDLSVPVRTIAGVDLAGDDVDPFAFYLLPPVPAVAIRDGRPAISLLRFVRDGQLTGGHLELELALAHPPAMLEQGRQQLAEALKDDRKRVTLRPLPVTGGEAELMFVGRETADDGGIGPLLRRGYGKVTPDLQAPFTATFSVMLTAPGAALVEAAMRSGGAPIGVIYRLRCEGLRPAQRILAHVDWSRVYQHLSSSFKAGDVFVVEDLQKIAEQLVESKAVTIQVVQAVAPDDRGAPPDLGPALEWIQREIVEKCCEPVMRLDRKPAHASLGVLGEMFGVGACFAIKALTQTELITADIDFRRDLVTVRTLTAEAALTDLLGGVPAAGQINDAGLNDPFFARVALHLTTAEPLASSFVQELIARFTYGATQVPIRLTPAATEGKAEAWADAASDHTWSLPIDLTLAPDAPVDAGAAVSLPALSGQERELKLDLARMLGLRSIEVRGSTDDRVLMTRMSLQPTRGGKPISDPRETILTAAQPAQTVWFRGFEPGDGLTASVSHLLKDNRAITLAPFAIDTTIARLPPPFPGTMAVQMFSDDDWSGIERVVVTLQKNPALPAGTFTFDKPSMAIAVDLDLPDPADRSYRYKSVRMLSDGTTEEDDWMTTDRSTLLVGRFASDLLVVDVTPIGSELPAAGISLIEVQLQYVDSVNQVLDNPTAIIRARADRYHWVVALKNPNLRSYEYRVTVHRASGATQTGPWTTSTDHILAIPVVAGG